MKTTGYFIKNIKTNQFLNFSYIGKKEDQYDFNKNHAISGFGSIYSFNHVNNEKDIDTIFSKNTCEDLINSISHKYIDLEIISHEYNIKDGYLVY